MLAYCGDGDGRKGPWWKSGGEPDPDERAFLGPPSKTSPQLFLKSWLTPWICPILALVFEPLLVPATSAVPGSASVRYCRLQNQCPVFARTKILSDPDLVKSFLAVPTKNS